MTETWHVWTVGHAISVYPSISPILLNMVINTGVLFPPQQHQLPLPHASLYKTNILGAIHLFITLNAFTYATLCLTSIVYCV